MRVEWDSLARLDLVEIVSYIAEDNVQAAYRVRDAITRQVELLKDLPEMGRPGRVTGTRELVIVGTSFVAAYRVAQKEVLILRVLHGARRWPDEI